MPIFPTWTEGIQLRTDAALAAGATYNEDLDLDNLGADRYEVQIDIDIGSSSGVTVKVFGSPDSGTTFDSTPFLQYTVDVDDIRTIVLTGAYRRVAIINDDGSNATTGLELVGAWRQWDTS